MNAFTQPDERLYAPFRIGAIANPSEDAIGDDPGVARRRRDDYAARACRVCPIASGGVLVTDSSSTPSYEPSSTKLDTGVPHSARLWNY
jgi:hypothetical protein